MNGDFLQNMAPNAKRAFFVTGLFAAVAVILYLFCVQPAIDGVNRAKRNLADLQSQMDTINGHLRRADLVNNDLKEVNAKLKDYADTLLVPLLGSYAMRAKSLLDPLAAGAGLKGLNYEDEPFRALPLPKPMPRQLHTRAAIKVTAIGSYPQAVSFLLRVEKDLPHVSLQSFQLDAQQEPTKQKITLVLEWPAIGGLTRK